MAIDKTKRPLKIPPQFQLYAEEHGLFDLYHRMLQQLIIDLPEDPLEYMINWFKRESDPVPKIAVIGAPASGTHSVAKKMAENLGAVLVKACPHANSDEEIVSELTDRLRSPGSEPVRRGFVLEDLPKNKRQALLLQQNGISLDHILVLEAPEGVLLGRRAGKMVDPEGNVYHQLFDFPEGQTDKEKSLRDTLTKAPNSSREQFEKDYANWRRESIGILDAYESAKNIRHVNADQPLQDVCGHCSKVVLQPNRSESPIIPRVVLIGPTGSGKNTIANFLSQKYKIANVDAEKCVRIVSNDKGSSTGDAIRTYFRENNIDMENPDLVTLQSTLLPDELFVRCINERLSRMDCQTKGWILYNFPVNFQQVEALNMLGHRPNKVLSLELPLEAAFERLSNRMLDPETGNQYHLLWNAPENQQVTDRLVRAPCDAKEVIEARYVKFLDTINTIKAAYLEQEKQHEKTVGGILSVINADQDVTTVLEYCESMLINPIPHAE